MVLKRKEGLTFGEVDILWQLNLRVSDVVFRAVSSSPKVLSFFKKGMEITHRETISHNCN